MEEAKFVYKAIRDVMAELVTTGGISKDRNNAQQNYKFRGIDDVLNTLAPLLSKHMLCILPMISNRHTERYESKNGGWLFYTTVEADFTFVSAVDGSTHTIRALGEAMDSGDKSTNKAMSAAMKYACIMAFCIPTEGDNDADATTHEVANKATVAKKAEEKQAEEPKAKTSFQKFINEMNDMRKKLGDQDYYAVLGSRGFKHSNEIKTRDQQIKVFKELAEKLNEREKGHAVA